MNAMCFERKVMKGFVLPGIAVVILIILMLFVQPWISTDILTHPIGGPAGMALGFAMFLLAMMFMGYMLASIIYAVLLPVKYFKRSESFLGSVRRFVLFSDVFLVLMDVMLLNAYIESVRWNFFSSLNLALVVPMTVLILIMTAFFICWTRIVYRHLGCRFFTWKTLGEVVLSLFLLQVPAIATSLYAMFIY